MLSWKPKEHGADNGEEKAKIEHDSGTEERGVKRMKVSNSPKEESEAEEDKRSFVETKWADMPESEKKRES